MVCPICGSKMNVSVTRYNKNEGETYRRRICSMKNCEGELYTVEFKVEETESFKKQWKDASLSRG